MTIIIPHTYTLPYTRKNDMVQHTSLLGLTNISHLKLLFVVLIIFYTLTQSPINGNNGHELQKKVATFKFVCIGGSMVECSPADAVWIHA